MPSFVWKGKTYQGNHEPIINRELWDKAQAVLDGRNSRPTRKTKREFAFSGLIRCGHCGSAVVAEMKKGRYVYYHCSRAKQNRLKSISRTTPTDRCVLQN